MFANYFRIVFRNLRKNRLYTLINIVSLGIGVAAMIWGIQCYRFYTGFDRFQVNRDRVFRVLITVSGGDGLKGPCPVPLGAAAARDYPVVQEAVRWEQRPLAIIAPGKEPFATRANFTDPGFFNLFSFPLVRGRAELGDASTVLITETAAKKYFGGDDPLGKTLVLYSDQVYKRPLKVTGVVKNPPVNSSFQFETLTSTANFLYYDGSPVRKDDWGRISDAVFVKLADPRQASRLGREFSRYIPLEQAARQDLKVTSFVLQSISQLARKSNVVDKNVLLERPSDAAIYGPVILGILILLSACLNFANTTVAQSRRRLKEIGVRKVMGGSMPQIMMQQLVECALIVIPAIGLAMLLGRFWLDAYNAMLPNTDLHALCLRDHTLQLMMMLLFLGVILLAGAYPAFYIGRFNATKIFRGAVRFGGRNLFSRFLLGLQIIITFITLITSIAFARNAAFQRDYDYGYRRDGVMGVLLPGGSDGMVLRNELARMSGVERLAGVRDQIGFSYHTMPLAAEGKKKECVYLEVGPGYTDLMGLSVVAGRVPATSVGGVGGQQYMLINEKLAFAMGWTPAQAVGKVIRKDENSTCLVAGVLKDFTQNSFQLPIQPLAMCLIGPDEKVSQWVIRAQSHQLPQVYDQVRAFWSRVYPATPFSYYFQDEVSVFQIRLNDIVTKVFAGFALISILMAATGMYALVSLTVLKRLKEIVIRQVVGARVKDIFWLVGKGYGGIFLVSSLVGCGVGFLLSRQLMNLVFQINAGVRADSMAVSFMGILVLSSGIIFSRVWFLSRVRAADVLKAD